ncbi:MAG: SDR family NAD(P)-dependent oxidoreductase [Actinomycetia bacterium]|nr:SDR family NAD(P)-dependent oxidoreductase [Actinomycetes bacterium]
MAYDYRPEGRLKDKVAIVTGASRGIGQAIASVFAAEGARVVCAARTLREGDHPLAGSLEGTVAQIREHGGEATAVPCNIAEEAECERLVAETRRIYGPCDILVNNAALTYFLPIAEFPTNKWKRSFDVNVHAPFILSKLVLQDMLPRGSGRIVNISSGAAVGPGRGPYTGPSRRWGATMYGAEKAAIERFTQGLAEEVWPQGIVVAAVSPSKVVATAGTVYHHLVQSFDDPNAEPVDYMARAVLLLASAPAERVVGRVTYSQLLLQEFGWLDQAQGLGVDRPGSGYSQM